MPGGRFAAAVSGASVTGVAAARAPAANASDNAVPLAALAASVPPAGPRLAVAARDVSTVVVTGGRTVKVAMSSASTSPPPSTPSFSAPDVNSAK